ncbi:MAG: DNA polymerase III subunit beta, partial [Patescibacteria group bacterium]|nr:DNA polymerase III subunit beta [Patescibacteria group bacterium]
MQFSCTKENLYRGLSVVSHITTKNINLPILNNVLVKTENKVLKLISTNLEIATSCVIRGKIEGDGDFTVPAKLFADYINLLPNERVDCNEENEFLSIKCGNYGTKIKGIPAADFPLIPQISKESSHRVFAPDLKRAIERVIFAASTNESRPEISGVFVSFNPEGLEGKAVLAATDSYRLAESKLQLNSEDNNKKESVIIPGRTLAEVLRVISVVGGSAEGNDVVEICIGENQILFSHNGVELSSRLIEGQYPDYHHVV